MSKRNDNAMNVSTYMPIELIRMIDLSKGDISRNLWIKRAVIKALVDAANIQKNEVQNRNANQQKETNLRKSLQGSRIETPASQAATLSSPTTTNEEAGQQPPLIAKEEDHSLA